MTLFHAGHRETIICPKCKTGFIHIMSGDDEKWLREHGYCFEVCGKKNTPARED